MIRFARIRVRHREQNQFLCRAPPGVTLTGRNSCPEPAPRPGPVAPRAVLRYSTRTDARALARAGLLEVRLQHSDSLASERFAQFAAEGSHKALAEAFDLVAPELLRTARLLTRRAEEAAELVQDTFVSAIESRHRFEPGRSLVPWLVGILYNLHRHRSRARSRQIDWARLTAQSESEPSVLVDRQLVRATIDRGIDLLPPTYREVVALHLRDGKRPEEIAQALERPAGRIRTQLWRGLRLLRDTLPSGFGPLVIALLSVASARAAEGAAVDATGSDDARQTPPSTGTTTPVKRQPLRALRTGQRGALALLAPLGLVAALWLALGSGPGPDPAQASQLVAGPAPVPTTPTAPDATDSPLRRVPVPADPSASRGGVRVQLVWADSSQPAAHQSLRIQTGYCAGTSLLHTWFETVREGWTDDNGTVLFDGVPAGTARLLFDDGLVQSAEFAVVARGRVERTEQLVAVCEMAGIVVDNESHPVEGAEIWLSSGGGEATPGYVAAHSAADGTFFVRTLHQRTTVWATAPGYARSGTHCETQLKSARPRLVLWPSPGGIEGSIATSSGAPVAGLLVGTFPLRATYGPRTTAPSYQRADAHGHFSLSGLEPGPHLVAARGAGTCAQVASVEVGPGATARVDLRLPRGATVRGHAPANTIVIAEPQRPDATAGILGILAATTAVQADGTYCLEHVFPGVVELRLLHPGQPQILCRTTLEVVEGQLAEVDLEPDQHEPCKLRGRVVDDEGAPVSGIEVRSMPTEFEWWDMRDDFVRAVTDEHGRFALPVRPGVAYRCIAMLERGFAGAVSDAVTPEGPELSLTIPPAARTCSVRGFVLDACTPDAPIYVDLCRLLLRRFERIGLDARSRFAIDRLPPGDYALFAIRPHDRWHSRLTTIHLDAGETRDLGSLLAAPLRELRVHMRRTDGKPVRLVGQPLVHTHHGHVKFAAMSVAAGGVATVQLAPDEYEVMIEGVDFLPERRTVAVTANPRTDLIVDLRPARTCSFTFVLPDQHARTRLRLRIDGQDGGQLVALALGVPMEFAYRIELGLPPGTHRVYALTAKGLVADGEVIVPGGDPSGPPIVVNLPLR